MNKLQVLFIGINGEVIGHTKEFDPDEGWSWTIPEGATLIRVLVNGRTVPRDTTVVRDTELVKNPPGTGWDTPFTEDFE